MKESDYLFELIKSLTKAEKRYFKMNITAGSNYVKLFDAVCSLKKYDEDILRKKFSSEGFLKNLAYNKLYLYNEILNSLTALHSKKTVESEIRGLLAGADFLKGKGLMTHAKKLIDKAYKLTDEEKYLYKLQALNSKADLKVLFTNPDERETFMEGIVNEQCNILDSVKNQMDYFALSSPIIKFMNIKGGIRTKQDRADVNKILYNPLLKDVSRAKSTDAKCYFYFIKHLCYLGLGQLDDAYEYSKKGVELLKDADMEKSLMRARLRTALGAHLLLLRYFRGKDEEFIESLRKYRTAVYPDRNRIPGRFIDSYNSEILFNNKKALYEQNTSVLAELKYHISGINEYRKVSEYYFLASNAAYSEFICGNYDSSLKWLNVALKGKDNIVSHKAATLIMILSLILHYELKNFELLENQMISTYRYLAGKKRLYKYETLALEFIRKSVKNISHEELIEKFVLMKVKLIEISSDPNEKAAFEDFDLISWLESNIKGKPFIEILKQKAGIQPSKTVS